MGQFVFWLITISLFFAVGYAYGNAEKRRRNSNKVLASWRKCLNGIVEEHHDEYIRKNGIIESRCSIDLQHTFLDSTLSQKERKDRMFDIYKVAFKERMREALAIKERLAGQDFDRE